MRVTICCLITALLVPTVALSAGPPAKSKFDAKYITNDFVGAIVAHPKRALNGPVLKALLAEVEKSGGKAVSEEPFRGARKGIGLDLRNMQQVVILIDRNSLREFPLFFLFGVPRHRHDHGIDVEEKVAPPIEGRSSEGAAGEEAAPRDLPRKTDDSDGGCGDDVDDARDADEPTPPPTAPGDLEDRPIVVGPDGRPRRHYGPAMIFRLSKPMDRKAVMKAWAIDTYEVQVERFANGRIKSRRHVRKQAPPTRTVYKSFTYYVNHRTAFYIPDDRTLVSAPEPLLKKMLDSKGDTSPLIAKLKSLGSQPDGAVVLDVKAIAPSLAAAPREFLPRDVVKLLGYLPKLKTLTATANITGKPAAAIALEAADAKTAAELAALVDKRLLPLGKAFYEIQRPYMLRHTGDPTTQTLFRLFDGIVEQATASQRGTDVVVATTGPKDLVALAAQFGRVAGAQAKQARRKNNLKQIGLAFHNYHDTYGRMPGHGTDAAGRSGLSWRVHLLPFLEQAELYRQFKLDEAWDSPHNKKLIAKMPKIFRTPGATAAGKTSIHVFTGDGTPFGIKGGPRFRDILDGTSNTFMAVEAGVDKADFWTKPGGIAFDATADPRKLLGKIDARAGFIAGMMDGSVYVIKSDVSEETLRRMIQHRDGKVVDFQQRRRRYGRADAVPDRDLPDVAPPSEAAAPPGGGAELPRPIDIRKKP